MITLLRRMLLTSSLALLSCAAVGQSLPDSGIPAMLKDWRGWVLKDQEFRTCPFLGNEAPQTPGYFVCAWPSRLTINAGADGATFSIRWQVDAPTWIVLPGEEDHWPQQVTVNNQRQPVVDRAGVPSIRLPAAGSFDVAGKMSWKQRPQTLSVPSEIGLVTLSVDGKPIAPVQRAGNAITLGRAANAAPENDSMEIRVFRKLTDGTPAILETQLVVGASGQAREEALGPVLPEGFVPLSLSGEWPARLDDDGRLHIQVQAGTDTLTIKARAVAPLTSVKARMPDAPWPAQETWSYESNAATRVTTASSAIQVDPRQAGVPEEWVTLPAFALSKDADLKIDERSRGLGTEDNNRLTLNREAWLDFDGGGWFANDRVSGTMVRGWRFDVAAPFVLERADAANAHGGPNDGAEALLVTQGATSQLSGVEWRTPSVDLRASVRVPAATSTISVAGWQDTFDQITQHLHLPYGYRLIAAPGADSAAGSWASNWTLLDAFVCAILALLAWRYLGVAGAVITALYLVLAYQEHDAPFWTLLTVAALALIVRALPQGRLRAWAEGFRRFALLVLILATLPFVAEQLRLALYPQLESGGYAAFAEGGLARYRMSRDIETASPVITLDSELKDSAVVSEAAPMPIPPPAAPPPRTPAEQNQKLETIVVTGSRIPRSALIDHYSQSTVVQTGRGEPRWQLGSTAELTWSGPVLAAQTVHLLIAPPWLVRPLRVLLVLLLGWLVWQLSKTVIASLRTRVPLSAAALLIGGLIVATPTFAQTYPPNDMLDQLRQRLTEAPKCAPTCAAIADAQITANSDAIVVALDVQAVETLAVPLPQADTASSLKSIKVDGALNEGVTRHDDGSLWLAVNRGVHRVELEYTAFADRASLKFPLRPGRAQLVSTAWEGSGINEDRLLGDTVNLTRVRTGANDKIAAGAQQFPAYVRVIRHVTLGLQWSVDSTVQRVAPEHGGITVAVPILQGEHVVSAGARLDGNRVLATIADGSDGSSWGSTFDKVDAFTLTAPPLTERAEVWRIVVSPTWHAEFSGVPESVVVDGVTDEAEREDYREFQFAPLPGETLTVKVTRPAAVKGETRAVDSVNVVSELGQHAATHTLDVVTRASQGGEQTITVPNDAELLGVQRDNQTLNVRLQDGKLSLPVIPGPHRFQIRFRQTSDFGAVVRSPNIDVGLPAANVHVALTLPADRWLLATWGPRVGPAVLYWGELLVMILVAFALSRTRRTSLKFQQWLLLGFGFSTFSWTALVVVVAWLFAFDWRARTTVATNRLFNLAQFALAILTVAAMLCLVSAIPQGLLGQPDMHVTGYGSTAHALHWFVDRSQGELPTVHAFSAPLWVYKVLMLVWALWLANALIGWLRAAFAAWTTNGYWRPRVKTVVVAAPPQENP